MGVIPAAGAAAHHERRNYERHYRLSKGDSIGAPIGE
jgi:hypothetical protein